jgi:hypothetical protein
MPYNLVRVHHEQNLLMAYSISESTPFDVPLQPAATFPFTKDNDCAIGAMDVTPDLSAAIYATQKYLVSVDATGKVLRQYRLAAHQRSVRPVVKLSPDGTILYWNYFPEGELVPPGENRLAVVDVRTGQLLAVKALGFQAHITFYPHGHGSDMIVHCGCGIDVNRRYLATVKDGEMLLTPHGPTTSGPVSPDFKTGLERVDWDSRINVVDETDGKVVYTIHEDQLKGFLPRPQIFQGYYLDKDTLLLRVFSDLPSGSPCCLLRVNFREGQEIELLYTCEYFPFSDLFCPGDGSLLLEDGQHRLIRRRAGEISRSESD